MRKLILLFAIIGVVASYQMILEPCKKNEVRDYCLNPNGPCYDSLGRIEIGSPNPRCCEPGCRCRNGYVKSKESGKCVPRKIICKFSDEE